MGRSKTKRNTRKQSAIQDVPFSRKISLGPQATQGKVDYHYMYYDTFVFFNKLLTKHSFLQKRVCIPKVGQGWLQSFLSVSFDATDAVQLVDSRIKIQTFITKVNECMKHRFVPINLQIICPKKDTHANMLLIDTHKKTVELFEPHGGRHNYSTIDGEQRAYYKVKRHLHKFFKRYFPKLKFITPEMYLPYHSLQYNKDAYGGMCVTWCILYLHYRILNPSISQQTLVRYLDKTITETKLLQYARYVEDTLKGKI